MTSREENLLRSSTASASQGKAGGSLAAGLLAGLAASACCAGPLVLLMLGVSGSWIGNLTALEPYRPLFIGASLSFFWLAYRKLYVLPLRCADTSDCKVSAGLRLQRRIFWILVAVTVLAIAFPWYAPLFLE